MAKSTPSVVLLRSGNTRNVADRPVFEAIAGGAITPGHKITLDYSTTPPTAVAATGATVEPAGPLHIAVTTPYGDAANAIDDAYASGDVVYYIVPQRGDVLYVLAAVGVSLALEDLVIDGGATTAGCFAEVSPATPDATVVANTIKGIVRTAVTGGAAVVRFEMEVL